MKSKSPAIAPDGSRRLTLKQIVAELRAMPENFHRRKKDRLVMEYESDIGKLLRAAIDAGAFADKKWAAFRNEAQIDLRIAAEDYHLVGANAYFWLSKYADANAEAKLPPKPTGQYQPSIDVFAPWLANLIEAEGKLNRAGTIPPISTAKIERDRQRQEEQRQRWNEQAKEQQKKLEARGWRFGEDAMQAQARRKQGQKQKPDLPGKQNEESLPPGNWLMPPQTLKTLASRVGDSEHKVKKLLAPYDLRNWPSGNRQSYTVNQIDMPTALKSRLNPKESQAR